VSRQTPPAPRPAPFPYTTLFRSMDLTSGRGADLVIVCAASAQAQQAAVRMAARRGRISLFTGLPRGSQAVSLDTNLIHYREVRRSEEHTSELQSLTHLVCRLLLD